ncbi:hypothetical protein N7495_002440 [Penicillium taxi]|uniref:uncharacterized protein n=1 Tax=Penicillium taxi TaxID=168475 RepID=UPI002544E7B7|nr:uncharacterized protein N7495_002440 [Penicillium taxi]KAJ5901912.1 hypothetical protein N7495_002440 [Penicillium taxi]
MVKDDYSSGGGKLKLKGSKVSDGRVEKKKKKSLKKKEKDAETKIDSPNPNPDLDDVESGKESVAPVKTETEKRHDELRRKRLQDRLAREGIKTHKERVEELNTYLSKLSEHHDMPKIGPG